MLDENKFIFILSDFTSWTITKKLFFSNSTSEELFRHAGALAVDLKSQFNCLSELIGSLYIAAQQHDMPSEQGSRL